MYRLRKTEDEYAVTEDLPFMYDLNRIKVEEKFKLYFDIFIYDAYTKELILDMATRTYERGLRWANTPKYQ